MKSTWIFSIVALLGLVVWGCDQATTPQLDPGAGKATQGAAETAAVFFCGGCGQIKGSDACCAAGAATCSKCGLAKGSPGCCKIKKGTDVQLCTKCGQIKGSDTCCAADAEKCAKCGLAKGSPGCCKINTVPKAPTTGSDAKVPASGSGVK